MSDRRPDEREDFASIEALVAADPSLDDEPPPTAEELAAADRLREALGAAGGPRAGRADLPGDVHERLLAAALGTEARASEPAPSPGLPRADAAVTAAERREADRLRDRLAEGWRPDPEAEPDDPVEALVDVAAALRSAHDPRPLDEVAAARALARVSLGRRHAAARGGRLRLGWGLALAAAAAAALVVLPRTGLVGDGGPTASLVPARSTQPLFDPAEPFPREGGTSDRIDRIAAARRADLRQNRFARWGIR